MGRIVAVLIAICCMSCAGADAGPAMNAQQFQEKAARTAMQGSRNSSERPKGVIIETQGKSIVGPAASIANTEEEKSGLLKMKGDTGEALSE